MSKITKLPLLATNLKTGLPNESDWQGLEGLSPKCHFENMKQTDDVTYFLKFDNFEFDFNQKPNTYLKLSGIEIKVLRKGSNVKDFWIDLIYPSSVDEVSLTKNNKASDNVWPFIYTDMTYGGVQDQWGRSWTLKELNSEKFGVVIASKSTSSSAIAEIKRVEITIHYDDIRLRYDKKEIWQHKHYTQQL